jgi:hypothetical protein
VTTSGHVADAGDAGDESIDAITVLDVHGWVFIG